MRASLLLAGLLSTIAWTPVAQAAKPTAPTKTAPAPAPAKPAPAPAKTAAEPLPERVEATWLVASQTLQVDDRDAAMRAVIAYAEQRGGWFSALSDDSVTVRVPVADLPGLLEAGKKLGTLVDKSYRSQDLSDELLQLKTRLRSRRETLSRYLAVLQTAGADSTVVIGRAIAESINEIEGIEGRIRLLSQQAEWAQATFSFRFRDRAAPSTDGSSPFAWINSLNLASILNDFRYGSGLGRSAGVTVPTPDGFAAFHRRSQYAAINPDDVKLRVRTFRHKPKADLGFWTEALRTRMLAAGYLMVAEEKIESASGQGSLLELTAPYGDEDLRYLIAVFVDGGRLVVVEAVGEASDFKAQREGITGAIRGMRF